MDEFAFDFERGLEQNVGQPVEPPPSMPASGRKNYRMARVGAMISIRRRSSPRGTQTVCRHWLRGLCMKGNACGFLHQFEASRMPVCRFFAKYSECKVCACDNVVLQETRR
jgi:cleavage and polyadenylation specificity factor subunit 4